MSKLKDYFSREIESKTLQTIGAEVETQFIDELGEPISVSVSQRMFKYLVKNGWVVKNQKNSLITTLVDSLGNTFAYELGRQNLELSTIAVTTGQILGVTSNCLEQLYVAGRKFGAFPYFAPILAGDKDLLVIPDERDAIWLALDGRANLAPLARTSSVQFTISVSVNDAIRILNTLGSNIPNFLQDFPQEQVWRTYIAKSLAGYRYDRYGGPLQFESVDDYCNSLSKQDVVKGTSLVPYAQVDALDIPLYLRSIWWYFRLKRYGNSLCIEVRPLPRKTDDVIADQLAKVLDAFSI